MEDSNLSVMFSVAGGILGQPNVTNKAITLHFLSDYFAGK
jgi:hypothetical protein